MVNIKVDAKPRSQPKLFYSGAHLGPIGAGILKTNNEKLGISMEYMELKVTFERYLQKRGSVEAKADVWDDFF